MNDEPRQSPDPPIPPPPPPAAAAYTPPPLPPGYEHHYRPIYQPHVQKQPGNDSAMASIILACTSMFFLFISGGVLAPVTLIASSIAIPLGHKGQENVDKGRTTQNRDVAVAGFWTGIAGVALSLLAIIAWVVVVVVLLSSDFHWTDSNGQMHTFHNFHMN